MKLNDSPLRSTDAALLSELRVAADDVEALRLRAERAEAKTQEMLRSKSWRLTAPLRALRRWFRAEPPGAEQLVSLPPNRLAEIIARLDRHAPLPPAVAPRAERLRQYMDIDKETGLEIGPLGNAIVPRVPGRSVFYCDYAPQHVLRERSKDDPNVNTDLIPEIDFVAPSISSETFGGRKFDYVVASHVIEHVPDVISWLQTLVDSLNPGGRLVLAVPDRRYTFDFVRPLSTVGGMLEARWQHRTRPTPGNVYEANRMAMKVDTQLAWIEPPDPAMLDPYFTAAQVMEMAQKSLQGEYQDCHCWVFEYEQFLSVVNELRELGTLRARVLHHAAPVRGSNEFHVVLGSAVA
jgi:SAM-dependent methyltransferase